MADIIIKILTPADSFDLLSLDELKAAMGIPTTDTSQDAQLSSLITRYSDVISTLCHRVFAKEEVRETWRCMGSRRVFLSHWPALETDIASVESPRGSILDPSTYEFEERSGKLELFETRSEPIVVTYTGGYDLPEDAPPALKQALELLIREEQSYVSRLGISGVRSISHKEARVMFYDPFSGSHGQKGGMALAVSGGMNSLLNAYMRYEV
jgi:hypothetical protein